MLPLQRELNWQASGCWLAAQKLPNTIQELPDTTQELPDTIQEHPDTTQESQMLPYSRNLEKTMVSRYPCESR